MGSAGRHPARMIGHGRMPYLPFSRSADQSSHLQEALLRVRDAGAAGLAIFDLDGCLFDNRPRQIHILRELGSRAALLELWTVEPEHFLDWKLERTLRQAGIEERFLQLHLREIESYWSSRFYREELLAMDQAMPGAAQFVHEVKAAGVRVIYLTGRIEETRKGTLSALRRFGFPTESCLLHMRQDSALHETSFKDSAFVELQALGHPVLFLDNHPGNLNAFMRRYPDSLGLLVDTGHGPDSTPLLPGARRILGFLRDP